VDVAFFEPDVGIYSFCDMKKKPNKTPGSTSFTSFDGLTARVKPGVLFFHSSWRVLLHGSAIAFSKNTLDRESNIGGQQASSVPLSWSLD